VNGVEMIRAAFKTNHDFLAGTIAGVTDAEANASVQGNANPISATYGHIVMGEDALVNAICRDGAPMFASSHAGKTGFSEPPPAGPQWRDWALRVRADMAQAGSFAQAVFGATDGWLAGLTDADLDRVLDLPAKGVGAPPMPLGAFLSIVAANAAWHTGEIAALKGIRGGRGYPV
jgi:hypothetical protein